MENKIAISIKLFNVQKGGSVSSAKILVFLFEKIYVRVSISLARALSKLEKKVPLLYMTSKLETRETLWSAAF